jgi:hypothetical protein
MVFRKKKKIIIIIIFFLFSAFGVIENVLG